VSWLAICLLAAGTFALKSAGPLLLGGRPLPRGLERAAALLPASLLAALICVQTFGSGRSLVLDPRAAGMAAAAVATWRRAPFVVIVASAMIVAAAVRHL
jgi:branched-subunit amino acid transport protein